MPNDHAVGHCDTYIHTCCRFVPCGNEYWGFFFVYSLLACDLARSWRGYVQSGSRPQSALGGSLQAPLLPSAQAFPKKKTPPGEREKASQRKLQRKEPRKNKEKGAFRPLLLACRCHEQRRGGGAAGSSPSPSSAKRLRLHPAFFFPFPALPELPLRHLTPRVPFILGWHQPSHIRGGEEVQHRLAASPVSHQLPDLPPTLPPPRLFLDL